MMPAAAPVAACSRGAVVTRAATSRANLAPGGFADAADAAPSLLDRIHDEYAQTLILLMVMLRLVNLTS